MVTEEKINTELIQKEDKKYIMKNKDTSKLTAEQLINDSKSKNKTDNRKFFFKNFYSDNKLTIVCSLLMIFTFLLFYNSSNIKNDIIFKLSLKNDYGKIWDTNTPQFYLDIENESSSSENLNSIQIVKNEFSDLYKIDIDSVYKIENSLLPK